MTAAHHQGLDVDNAPGGATCPPWLLLLDEPSPRRVTVIGRSDEPAAAWFANLGADVELRAKPASGSAPVDLLVIGAGIPLRARGPRGLAAYLAAALASARPEQGVVIPWPAREGITSLLTHAGFTTLRPIREVLDEPGRRRSAGLVALRSASRTGPSPTAPPGWLEDLARGEPWAPAPGGWTLRVPQDYPSQKAVVACLPEPTAGPAAIVKVTRHPRFNDRLDNEAARLRGLASRAPAAARRAPGVLRAGRVAGLAYVAEEAIEGEPFLDVSRLDADCPLAADAVAAIGDLVAADHSTLPGRSLVPRLEDLLGRFEARHRPTADVTAFLARQIRTIGEADLPQVVFHGDLGTWNLLAADGSVRILDWESAEDPGPPLWDLAYFTRSYVVRAGRRRGLDRDRSIARHLLGTTPLNGAIARWFHGYATHVGLAPQLIEPLFHTTWLHRAVKESQRLAPGQAGHYGPLCIRLSQEHRADGLQRLVTP